MSLCKGTYHEADEEDEVIVVPSFTAAPATKAGLNKFSVRGKCF
jgi:hypothetical protein